MRRTVRWVARRLAFAAVMYFATCGLAYNLLVLGVWGW